MKEEYSVLNNNSNYYQPRRVIEQDRNIIVNNNFKGNKRRVEKRNYQHDKYNGKKTKYNEEPKDRKSPTKRDWERERSESRSPSPITEFDNSENVYSNNKSFSKNNYHHNNSSK